MASDFDGEQPHNQVTRREVLRRGAIIGGVLWASPVIQSFTSPAGAQAGSPPPDNGGDNGGDNGTPEPGTWGASVTPTGACSDLAAGACIAVPADMNSGGCAKGVVVDIADNRKSATVTAPSGYTLQAAALVAKGEQEMCSPIVGGSPAVITAPSGGWKIERVDWVINA